MRQHKLFVAAVVMLVAGMITSSAYASHAWGKYHWNLSTAATTATPLKIGDNLTSAVWKGSLSGAVTDWNASVLKSQVVSGTSNGNCDPTLGQVEVCNALYGDNGWLGIAQVWAYRGKDGHIAQGVVQLNDTYFNTPEYNTLPWRNLVMCQEVGHTFGLGHQDENFSNVNLGTCMDYTNDPDGNLFGQANNEHPNAHDYEMLKSIYAHVNQDTTTPGKKGRSTLPGAVDVNDPSSWGTAVKQDAQGKDSVYVRNLGNGMEVTTHVLWVPGTEDHHED